MHATLYVRPKPETPTAKAHHTANKRPWEAIFTGPLAECRARMEAVTDRVPAWGPAWDAYIDATACEHRTAPTPAAHHAGCRCLACRKPTGRFAITRPFTAIDTLSDALAAGRRARGGA